MTVLKKQDGFTILELLVVLAVVALLSTFAIISSASLITSGQVFRGIARVTYDMALSRERAIARYEQWRIRIITGSGVAQQYVVESCALNTPSTAGAVCPTGWTQQGNAVTLAGVGLQATAGGLPITQLIFDRTGQFYVPDGSGNYQQIAATVTVCAMSGTTCGVAARNVQLAQFSGMISVQ